MNVNAANALLKCLEEPGEKTLFLLVTDAPRQLLPTIRSRCQVLAFSLPEPGVASDWLVQQGLEREMALSCLRVAGGSPFKALAIAEGATLSRREEIFKAWHAAQTGRLSAPLAAEILAGNGASAVQAGLPGGIIETLHWIGQWWQEVARLRLDATAAIAEEARRAGLLELARGVDERVIFSAWDSTLALASAFQRGANFNVQLSVEGWLLGTTGSGR
jgi:DNA polymerase-3 subunit delta'